MCLSKEVQDSFQFFLILIRHLKVSSHIGVIRNRVLLLIFSKVLGFIYFVLFCDHFLLISEPFFQQWILKTGGQAFVFLLLDWRARLMNLLRRLVGAGRQASRRCDEAGKYSLELPRTLDHVVLPDYHDR